MLKNRLAMQESGELGRHSGGGNDHPLHYSCLEKSHGQECLVGYSLWGHKEMDMTELLSTHTHQNFYLPAISTTQQLKNEDTVQAGGWKTHILVDCPWRGENAL